MPNNNSKLYAKIGYDTQGQKILPIYFVVIFCLWAGIYLVGLGNTELQGEEGRRILPARNMLNSGDLIVMRIGGKVYKKKPPMISWLTAGSFKLFGQQNEWTARLPSALTALLAALAMLILLRGIFGLPCAFLSALIFLTSKEIFLKGRLAEIEALLVCFSCLACFTWLKLFGQKKYWCAYCLAGIFVGLGLLTKGPVLLFFYYVFVICILYKTQSLRHLIKLPHIVSVLIFCGIFLAWALPNKFALEAIETAKSATVGKNAKSAMEVWQNELWMRFLPEKFDFGDWLKHPFEGLLNFAPWIFFLGFFFSKRSLELGLILGKKSHGKKSADVISQEKIISGLILALVVGFCAVAFLPGSQGRFTMSLIPLACPLAALAVIFCFEKINAKKSKLVRLLQNFLIVLAFILAGFSVLVHFFMPLSFVKNLPSIIFVLVNSALVFWILYSRLSILAERSYRFVIAYGLILVSVSCIYASILIETITERDNVRPIAHKINQITQGNKLMLYKPYPSFQPFIFYLDNNYDFCLSEKKFSADYAFYLFFEPKKSLTRKTKLREIIAEKKLIKVLEFPSVRGANIILYSKNIYD